MSEPTSNGSTEAAAAAAPAAEMAAMALDDKANGGSTNGSAAASPANPSSTAALKEQFTAFSKFGDCKSDGKHITLSQSDKWMKQAKVIDKQITTTDTGIHFKKFKQLKITFVDYKKFLEDLAKTKNVPMADIVSKLSNCGAPGIHQVNVSGSAVYSLMTESQLKSRFFITGRKGRSSCQPTNGPLQVHGFSQGALR